jgi:hypothetical protein
LYFFKFVDILPMFCRFLQNDVFWTPAIFSPKRFLQHCFVVALFQAGTLLWGFYFLNWPLAGLSVWVVTCEGGKPYLCLISLLPLQNPSSPRTSPLGLTSLKGRNHPIVVTLSGIGSCYPSLAFYLIAFYPSYKLCDNRDHTLQPPTSVKNRCVAREKTDEATQSTAEDEFRVNLEETQFI